MWLTGRQRHTYKGRQESLSDTAGPDFSCPHRAGESLAIVGAPSPCDAGGLSGRLSGQGASRRGGATARRTAARPYAGSGREMVLPLIFRPLEATGAATPADWSSRPTSSRVSLERGGGYSVSASNCSMISEADSTSGEQTEAWRFFS